MGKVNTDDKDQDIKTVTFDDHLQSWTVCYSIKGDQD